MKNIKTRLGLLKRRIGETPLTKNWNADANKITLQKKGYKKVSIEVGPYQPVMNIELEPE